jgi:DNA-binding transcriptional regulator LsrR (DeoR family)
MMLLKEPPSPNVIRVAHLWQSNLNTWDISKRLHIPEPEVVRLLDEAKQRGLVT